MNGFLGMSHMNDCHCKTFPTNINARDNNKKRVDNKLLQFIFYDDDIVSFIYIWIR